MPIGAGPTQGRRSSAVAQMSPRDSLGILIAPFNGVVTSVGVAVGDMVQTSAPVVTLADPSTVWMVANVPEREAVSVRPGETATVRFDAYAGHTFSGHVMDVASQADATTGTVAVRCELPNADGALRANMFGTVEIAAPLDHDAVLVPEAALQDVNGQTAVFVPAGKGRFVWRAVHAGETSNGMTEIVSGVASGTPVVADGSYWLKAALLQGAIPDEG
jgi:cobalt-zinc-cadmium efflux system membrane fusion protein